jgi:SAM-dependent methyltransferase
MTDQGAKTLRSVAYLARRLLERTLRFGPYELRRTTPLHASFGYHRGTPIDRYYIDRFLATNAELIHGDGLEVGEDRYLSRLGVDRIRSATTLQLTEPGPGRLVGDLTECQLLPEGVFDCFICTQTLNFIYDTRAALRSCRRLLRPGGTLLLTVAGIAQLSRYDAERWGDFWRFTPQGLSRLAQAEFGEGAAVTSWGNVLAATALLHGLVVEELDPAELDVPDPDYPVVISLLAKKH